jgi:hypothetical protein
MGPDVPSPFEISDRRACTENEMSEIILPDLPFWHWWHLCPWLIGVARHLLLTVMLRYA